MTITTAASEQTPPATAGCVPPRTESGRSGAHLVQLLGVRSPVSVSGSCEERIAAIASRQRGCASRRQLRAARIDRGAVSRRVARGSLIRWHAQVFVVGHAAPAPLRAETAALLAVRAGALLSHLSAALVWGLLDPKPHPPVDVLVVGGAPARVPGVIGHRTRALHPDDARIHDGLPVTSVARVLIDLADVTGDGVVRRAFNQAVVLGVVRSLELKEAVARTSGRRGEVLLRELASDPTEQFTRSEAEERLLALLLGADLPRPRVNVRLHGFEVDFHWPAERFVVEVDGFRFHSSRSAFERDRARDATLQAAGIEVMRVTWRQLEHEPLAVVARIAAALARRARNIS